MITLTSLVIISPLLYSDHYPEHRMIILYTIELSLNTIELYLYTIELSLYTIELSLDTIEILYSKHRVIILYTP